MAEENDSKALRQRYEVLKGAENHKNHLIEVNCHCRSPYGISVVYQELLRRVDQLTIDYHQEKLDHARESYFNREVQQREIRLQNEIQQYKALMVSSRIERVTFDLSNITPRVLTIDRIVMPSSLF